VKVIVAEAETDALLAFLGSRPTQVTSRIATVEVARAVARQGAVDPARASAVLEQVTLIELDAEVADRAAALAPATLRSLDAIHLATAIGIRRELDAVITYDARLAAAADVHGLPVATPGLRRG
jgi:predicted nucleic acid-binding protein